MKHTEFFDSNGDPTAEAYDRMETSLAFPSNALSLGNLRRKGVLFDFLEDHNKDKPQFNPVQIELDFASHTIKDELSNQTDKSAREGMKETGDLLQRIYQKTGLAKDALQAQMLVDALEQDARRFYVTDIKLGILSPGRGERATER